MTITTSERTPARRTFHAVAGEDGWNVEEHGRVKARYHTRAAAEAAARRASKGAQMDGQLASAVMHRDQDDQGTSPFNRSSN